MNLQDGGWNAECYSGLSDVDGRTKSAAISLIIASVRMDPTGLAATGSVFAAGLGVRMTRQSYFAKASLTRS